MQEAADMAKTGMVSVLGTNMTEAKVRTWVLLALLKGGKKVFELAAAVSKTVGTKCSVANILCLGNVVVSGDEAACNEVMKQAESFGASKTVKLTVAGAFHSG